MFSKELKKMSRRELIDIIYQMKKNEQQMQEEIASLQVELQEKRVRVSKAGSIAEAALAVTDVFADAQAAADLYLQEMISMKAETEQACTAAIEEANGTAEKILSEGKKKYEALRNRYRSDYLKWQRLREEVKKLEELS